MRPTTLPFKLLALASVLIVSACITPKPLTRGISKNKKLIRQNDTSKIHLDGVYMQKTTTVFDDIYPQSPPPNTIRYRFFRFFPNGTVYLSSTFFNLEPTIKDIRSTPGDSNIFGGVTRWGVYYINNDNIYIEYYTNGYSGYCVFKGKLTKKQIEVYMAKSTSGLFNAWGTINPKVFNHSNFFLAINAQPYPYPEVYQFKAFE